MKTKKLLSMALALVLMLSTFAINSVAAIDESKAVVSIADMTCKLGNDVTVSVKATAKIANFTFVVSYASDALEYVADSFVVCDDAITLLDSSAGTIKFTRTGESKDIELDNEELVSFKLSQKEGILAENETSKDFDITLAVAQIDLVGDGTMLEDDCYNAGGDCFSTESGAGTYSGGTLSIVRAHTEPSITGVVMSVAEGTVGVIGNKITAATEGWSDNWNLPDKSTFKWTIGEDVVSETAEYTPAEADLGKELKVTAIPTVLEEDGAEDPFVGEEKSATVKVVAAPTYAPTAEVTLAKVTLKKEVELDYTLNKYDNGTDASTYAWYVMSEEDAAKVIEAKDIAAVEGAAAVEGMTTANPTFNKDDFEQDIKGMWAVVEVTAKETIGDDTYPLEGTEPNVYYAAAEIKSAATNAVQGGASLVTGTTNTGTTTPSTDDKKDEETTTPDDGTTTPDDGEENAATADPAGTANEAGASAFTDVDKEAYAWAYDGIDALAKAGVIKGMTETTFGPELTTTNAQVIALAVRIAGLTAEEGATTDKVDADHWVAPEMAAADANEILAVFGDAIDVEAATTREIAFTVLYNALKAAGVELAETAEAIEFTDAASIDAACTEAINALVKADIVHGMGDGTLAPKATITRAQLAKILGLANALVAAK